MSAMFFRTAIVFIILTLSMKLMGKREIGELEVGELISALLISEICSMPIDDPDIPILNAIIPVIFLVSLEIIISFIKNKSRRLKRAIDGSSSYLIRDGKLMPDEFIKNRISIEEFYSAIRQTGVGSVCEIKHCILEANGKISVIQSDVPTDIPVIIDGEINEKAAQELGLDDRSIRRILGKTPASKVFILARRDDGSYNIILKEENE
jgi:uncharacterized membrane protein YcaP (DUF421 family)